MGRPIHQENPLNESEMYAAIGRKQTELDNLNVEYDRLLAVLSQVSSGEVVSARVSVDLSARTWAVAAVEPLAAPAEVTVQ